MGYCRSVPGVGESCGLGRSAGPDTVFPAYAVSDPDGKSG